MGGSPRHSSWNPAFGDAFQAAIATPDALSQLDIGCAVEHGAFSLSDEGSDRVLHTSPADAALITFAMTFLKKLQSMGSAPAIDYDSYLKALPGPA